MSSDQELVDVLDSTGQPIRVVTRREMRTQRLLHRCTYVLVFDRQERLFVHLRTACKDVYPSYWDVTIGGVVLAGESFEQGMVREIGEELGIAATADELFPFDYEDALTRIQGRVYRLDHEGPFRLQEEEIVRGEFLSPPELDAKILQVPFCPDGLLVLEKYRRRWA